MKKQIAGVLCALLTLALLPEAMLMAQSGKYQRFVNKDLKAQLRTAKERNQKIPVMNRGLSAEDRAATIETWNQVVAEAKKKGGSPGLQQSVRLWEAMSSADKEQVLSGNTAVAYAPAAIGLVMFAYIVARDVGRADGKKINMRSLSGQELDYINNLKMDEMGSLARAERGNAVSTDLDYGPAYN